MRSVVIYYNIGSFLFQPSRSFSSSSFYRHTHTGPSVIWNGVSQSPNNITACQTTPTSQLALLLPVEKKKF